MDPGQLAADDRARVKPTTFHSYRQNFELHVIPVLGQRPVQQLTPPMLNGLYGQLAQASEEQKGLSAKTISYIHSTLHKVLSDAVDSGCSSRTWPLQPSRPGRTVAPRAGSRRGSQMSWPGSCKPSAGLGLRRSGASQP